MEKNQHARQEERSEVPDMDSRMIWMLVNHLRRARGQQARDSDQAGDDDSDDNGGSSDSDSQEEGGAPECMQS